MHWAHTSHADQAHVMGADVYAGVLGGWPSRDRRPGQFEGPSSPEVGDQDWGGNE